jgi:hypothetical protein
MSEEESEISRFVHTYSHVQGDSRGNVNILGGVVSVIVRTEVHINMCLSLNSYRVTAVRISRPTPLDILWGWMKSEVYKRKVDKPDEMLAHILDAAAHIQNRGVQLRRTTRDLRTRVAKATEVGGGICEHSL